MWFVEHIKSYIESIKRFHCMLEQIFQSILTDLVTFYKFNQIETLDLITLFKLSIGIRNSIYFHMKTYQMN